MRFGSTIPTIFVANFQWIQPLEKRCITLPHDCLPKNRKMVRILTPEYCLSNDDKHYWVVAMPCRLIDIQSCLILLHYPPLYLLLHLRNISKSKCRMNNVQTYLCDVHPIQIPQIIVVSCHKANHGSIFSFTVEIFITIITHQNHNIQIGLPYSWCA